MSGLRAALAHSSEAAAYRAGAAILRALPLGAARRVGTFGGGVARRLARGRAAMSRRHMLRVLGADSAAADAAVREIFKTYGRYFAETLRMSARNVDEMLAHFDLSGYEHVQAGLARGRGVVLALPHVGNWEIAGALLPRRGVRCVSVMEALPNQRLLAWFLATRTAVGIEVHVGTQDRAAAAAMLRALQANAVVALLCDRDVTGAGIEVRFFDEVTRLPAGPAMLALRTGAPLLPVAVPFTEHGYQGIVRPPIPVPELPRKEAVEAMTQALATALENLVRDTPSQWHLLQPNWPSDVAQA